MHFTTYLYRSLCIFVSPSLLLSSTCVVSFLFTASERLREDRVLRVCGFQVSAFGVFVCGFQVFDFLVWGLRV